MIKTLKRYPRRVAFFSLLGLGLLASPSYAQLGNESASGESQISELSSVIDATDTVVSGATGLALGAFGIRQGLKAANRATVRA